VLSSLTFSCLSISRHRPPSTSAGSQNRQTCTSTFSWARTRKSTSVTSTSVRGPCPALGIRALSKTDFEIPLHHVKNRPSNHGRVGRFPRSHGKEAPSALIEQRFLLVLCHIHPMYTLCNRALIDFLFSPTKRARKRVPTRATNIRL
jgi:hypothetical protein